MSFTLLPLDILQHEILEKYFVWDNEGPVNYPLAVTLLVLQYVNLRCRRLISNKTSDTWNCLENFRNSYNRDSVKHIGSAVARAFGSVALIKWLKVRFTAFKYDACITGAARGTS